MMRVTAPPLKRRPRKKVKMDSNYKFAKGTSMLHYPNFCLPLVSMCFETALEVNFSRILVPLTPPKADVPA